MKMFESFIIFDQKYCRQCHGIAMDSPLEPTLAVQLSLNMFCIGDLTHFRSTEHLIFNLKSVSTKFKKCLNNYTKTLPLHLKLLNMVHCHL